MPAPVSAPALAAMQFHAQVAPLLSAPPSGTLMPVVGSPGLKSLKGAAKPTIAIVAELSVNDMDGFQAASLPALADVHSKEPGCLLYCLGRDEEQSKFVFLELYTGMPAIQAHGQSTPYAMCPWPAKTAVCMCPMQTAHCPLCNRARVHSAALLGTVSASTSTTATARTHAHTSARPPAPAYAHTPAQPHAHTPTHPHTHTPTHPHTHTHTPPPPPLPPPPPPKGSACADHGRSRALT